MKRVQAGDRAGVQFFGSAAAVVGFAARQQLLANALAAEGGQDTEQADDALGGVQSRLGRVGAESAEHEADRLLIGAGED